MNNPPTFSARYDSTREAWEHIWDSASVERELELMQSARAKEALMRWSAYLSTEGVILEAGSGLSAAVITLRKMGYNVVGLDYAANALHISHQYDRTLPLNVVGLDYAANALHISHQYDRTLPLLVGDVHALPHAENSLMGYLSFGVLEHFEHGMMPALHEAYRVLAPGGIMVLTIPYPNVVYRLIEWRRKQANQSVLNDDEFYESRYTRDQLCKNVTDAGFEILEASPLSHAFTLWGLGGIFRGKGYYETSFLADALGAFLKIVLPWPFNFSTLVVARKPHNP